MKKIWKQLRMGIKWAFTPLIKGIVRPENAAKDEESSKKDKPEKAERS